MALTSALPTSLKFVKQSTTRGLWGFVLPTMELMLQFKGSDAVPLPYGSTKHRFASSPGAGRRT